MTRRRLTMVVAGGILALAGVWATGALKAQQPGFKRVELQKHDLGVPGREVVQARADFEPGAAIGKHTHPGEEFGYLLEGAIELEVPAAPHTLLRSRAATASLSPLLAR